MTTFARQSNLVPTKRYPVVVVGAGPVGLVAAIELAQSGVPVVLLDDDDTVSVGSRGVCYAQSARWKCWTASDWASRVWTRV